jgi:hypothetical protein
LGLRFLGRRQRRRRRGPQPGAPRFLRSMFVHACIRRVGPGVSMSAVAEALTPGARRSSPHSSCSWLFVPAPVHTSIVTFSAWLAAAGHAGPLVHPLRRRPAHHQRRARLLPQAPEGWRLPCLARWAAKHLATWRPSPAAGAAPCWLAAPRVAWRASGLTRGRICWAGPLRLPPSRARPPTAINTHSSVC